MVQRYIEIPQDGELTCMHEHFSGDYVKYDDYQILKEMYDALSEKWLDVNGRHGALCDACISYGLEPTEMIKNELAK